MKLEITKEKVLEAAAKCSQAKETLKTLFPEVFEEKIKHRIGNRYLFEGRDEYILCKTKSYGEGLFVGLIELSSGNIWTNSQVVEDYSNISDDEFSKIVGKMYPVKSFTLKKVTNQ